MSHFLTIPINENGILIDPNIDQEIRDAAVLPFKFTDVFIYSHGWWNYASSAMAEYNVFSLGFSTQLQHLLASSPGACAAIKEGFSALAIGLHWPSTISEDQNAVTNFLEATSFFTMQRRADTVGDHALYALLRLLIEARHGQPPLRFHMIGHSFGCRVLCAALQTLAQDTATLALAQASKATFHVALIQPATDADSLAAGKAYGDVLTTIPELRMLITTSKADTALGEWYPAAQRIAHLFNGPAQAMGHDGPVGNLATPVDRFDIDPASPAVAQATGRLSVVDLTRLHQSHAAQYGANRWGGQHSDINLAKIYELLVRFLGNA